MNVALENTLARVNSEITNILQSSTNENRGEFIIANDKNNILKENITKYNALLRMKELINS